MVKITTNIKKLRENIDLIDSNILKLISNRIELVKKIGELKSTNGERIYLPEREYSIYRKLSSEFNIPSKDIKNFYTEIISFCRKYEKTIEVAIFKNNSSLLALKKILGEYTKPIFVNFFKEIENNSISYFLASISKEIIKSILNTNWFIINNTTIGNETYYLFSKFNNIYCCELDYTYVLSHTIFSKNYIKLDSNSYINIIYFKDIDRFKNFNYTILGTIPNITSLTQKEDYNV